MPGVLRETFTKTIEESRAADPDTVGPGYYALMRLDEFVPSRIVEAVVHGLDLTDALGSGADGPARKAVAITAAILDDLLARRTVAGRPADLADDLAWVRAASGRGKHPDPRLPAHRLTPFLPLLPRSSGLPAAFDHYFGEVVVKMASPSTALGWINGR